MKRPILILISLVFNLMLVNSIIAQNNVAGMKLIPGGEYTIGKDSESDKVFSPAHNVIIDSFYIDIHEVTNKEYHDFCIEAEWELPEFWGIDKYRSGLKYPDCPVIGVSKNDAMTYAKHVGKRLPTEAEWEIAARGGLIGKEFSNGDDFKDCIILDSIFILGERTPYDVTLGNPNGYGLYGMSGNAREWVYDKYNKDYYKISPIENPAGPESGRLNVVRGGGWKSGTACKKVYLRNALRGSWVDIAVGFRCAKDVD